MYLTTASRTASLLSRRCIVATSRAAFSSSTTDDFYTGTVKFYRRDKRYGIIVPDDKSIGEELFVHRTTILSDDHSDLDFPFLYRSDRVKFTTFREVEEGQNFRAHNVTLEDGTYVPKYRSNHVYEVKKRQKIRLGNFVYDILSADDVGSKSQDSILKEIQGFFNEAEKHVKEAEKLVAEQEAKEAKQNEAEENTSDSEDVPAEEPEEGEEQNDEEKTK